MLRVTRGNCAIPSADYQRAFPSADCQRAFPSAENLSATHSVDRPTLYIR